MSINYLVILTTKSGESLPENIARPVKASAAGWGIVGSVWLPTAGYKVRSFGQWAAATCAAPHSVVAGQYATSGIPCRWR